MIIPIYCVQCQKNCVRRLFILAQSWMCSLGLHFLSRKLTRFSSFLGSKNSLDCTLILTEGDSAKTLAVSGLGVVGRDKYGVFPLRGKILNVREASHKQVGWKMVTVTCWKVWWDLCNESVQLHLEHWNSKEWCFKHLSLPSPWACLTG